MASSVLSRRHLQRYFDGIFSATSMASSTICEGHAFGGIPVSQCFLHLFHGRAPKSISRGEGGVSLGSGAASLPLRGGCRRGYIFDNGDCSLPRARAGKLFSGSWAGHSMQCEVVCCSRPDRRAHTHECTHIHKY
eukprot:389605-Pyramimonas_sp.AAC.1